MVDDTPELERLTRRLDGRQYPAYRDLKGGWTLAGLAPLNGETLRLQVDHVQGDPYAAPSRVRLRVATGVPRHHALDPVARIACEDWLLRRFAQGLIRHRRGSGRSGEIRVLVPGPEVVARSAVQLVGDEAGTVEVRVQVGLPARGRRILGRQAWALFTEDLAEAAAALLDAGASPELAEHIESIGVQADLRSALQDAGLVAFVADGAILPRHSGVDPRPLAGAVPFQSPPELAVSLPTRVGPIVGMGVGSGITVITGGGFHGKSTVLSALQTGHLDFIPGDGRERVVTLADAVKIRAEDGRRVEKVDVSAFLADLPGGTSTQPLSTDDASGSTSQAAAVVEAIEAGAKVVLFDEDTCATNLMVRDDRMRSLIGADHEPITPLVERVQQLYTELGVSSVLVVGGIADFLAVAHRVICMTDWKARDATEEARALVPAPPEPPGPLPALARRCPERGAVSPTGKGRVRAFDGRRLEYGREEIDLAAIEQLTQREQAFTAGRALAVLAESRVDGHTSVPELLDALETLLAAEGLDVLSPFAEPVGDLVAVRRHEVAACLNRLRTLSIR